MNSDTGETANFLITTVAAQGHLVTPVMLKKWRDTGLLPRPRQQSLGRGRGTVAVYPPGTSSQLLRILTIREESGRFRPEQALWRLWWEGFPIETRHIQVVLETQLRGFVGWSASWRALSPDEQIGEIASFSCLPPSRLPAPLRKIRARINSRTMSQITSVLIRIATGEFSSWEEKGERDALLEGLGLDRAKRDRIGAAEPWLRGVLSDQLRELASLIRPERLKAALTATSDTGLGEARNELQAFMGLLYTVRLTVETIVRKEGALGLSLIQHPNDVDHTVMPGLLLGWLAARREPKLYAGYEALMGFAQLGAPISFFADLIRKADTEELPRRLAPSGSMTHGEDPSTCTSSLAPPGNPLAAPPLQHPSQEMASSS